MRRLVLTAAAVALGALAPAFGALAQTARTLDIYLIDVEGGGATLYVSPSGESLLIDAGNGGTAAPRDADRIAAVVREAGLKQIDNLIITHYHGDHIGGLAELADRVHIAHFIDHGVNSQPGPQIDPVMHHYAELYSKVKHTSVKPGDTVPIAGLDWRIVTSDGKVPFAPLPGGGARNPYCGTFTRRTASPLSGRPLSATLEDEQSVGSLITFGRFRALALGDFTWNKEFELMCPINRIGTVDLFVASAHGQIVSNSQLLVHAVQPRVILMNNGVRKGGQPETMQIFFTSPRLESVWQLHFSQLSGVEYSTPGAFIANSTDDAPAELPLSPMPQPPAGQQGPAAPQHNGPAHYIKVSARQDGSFSVTNSRNGFTKTYR